MEKDLIMSLFFSSQINSVFWSASKNNGTDCGVDDSKDDDSAIEQRKSKVWKKNCTEKKKKKKQCLFFFFFFFAFRQHYSTMEDKWQ